MGISSVSPSGCVTTATNYHTPFTVGKGGHAHGRGALLPSSRLRKRCSGSTMTCSMRGGLYQRHLSHCTEWFQEPVRLQRRRRTTPPPGLGLQSSLWGRTSSSPAGPDFSPKVMMPASFLTIFSSPAVPILVCLFVFSFPKMLLRQF
jgi:hypothetical protein